MKYEKPGTLAYYEAIPQIKPISLADVPVSNTTKSYRPYQKNAGDVLPDQQAVSFYTLNHLASLVKAKFTKHETLPGWADKIMHEYTKELAAQGRRMFYYMLIICTRESRHASGAISGMTNSTFKGFYNNIKGKGSTQTANWFLENPPNLKLGEYTKFLMDVFDKANFAGGYGGPKWGEIARTLYRFCIGEYSMEMLVDTAYTLSHNNGPIFNKGFLYSHYTNEIMKILDVQRSGQMPEYVLDAIEADNPTGNAVANERVRKLVLEAKKEMPDAFGDYVDWYKVEKLGALAKYPAQKAAQDKKHKVKVSGEFIGWFDVDQKNKVQIVKATRKQVPQKQGV